MDIEIYITPGLENPFSVQDGGHLHSGYPYDVVLVSDLFNSGDDCTFGVGPSGSVIYFSVRPDADGSRAYVHVDLPKGSGSRDQFWTAVLTTPSGVVTGTVPVIVDDLDHPLDVDQEVVEGSVHPVSGSAVHNAIQNAIDSISITKHDIGLSDVDNTSDKAKPVSDAVAHELSTLRSEINSISSSGSDYSGLSSRVTSVETEVEVIKNTVDGACARLSEVSSTVTGLSSTVSDLNDVVSTASTRIDDVINDVSAVSDAVNSVESDVENLSARVSDSSSSITSVNTAIVSLQANVGSLIIEMESVKNDVTSMEEDVSSASESAGTSASAVSLLTGRLNQAEQNIASYVASVSSVSSAVTTLGERVSAAETNLQRVGTAVDAANRVLRSVEALRTESEAILAGAAEVVESASAAASAAANEVLDDINSTLSKVVGEGDDTLESRVGVAEDTIGQLSEQANGLTTRTDALEEVVNALPPTVRGLRSVSLTDMRRTAINCTFVAGSSTYAKAAVEFVDGAINWLPFDTSTYNNLVFTFPEKKASGLRDFYVFKRSSGSNNLQAVIEFVAYDKIPTISSSTVRYGVYCGNGVTFTKRRVFSNGVDAYIIDTPLPAGASTANYLYRFRDLDEQGYNILVTLEAVALEPKTYPVLSGVTVIEQPQS